MTTEANIINPRGDDKPAAKPEVPRRVPDDRCEHGFLSPLCGAPSCRNSGSKLITKPQPEGSSRAPTIAAHAVATREGSAHSFRLARPPEILEPPVPQEPRPAPVVYVPRAAQRPSAMVAPVAKIVEAVCLVYGVTRAELMGKDRHKSIASARILAMGLAREHTGLSFPELGRTFGNRDHSTVMAACRVVARGPRNPIEDERWFLVRQALREWVAERPPIKVRIAIEEVA